MRKPLFLALTVTLALLLGSPRAHAQGGLHGSITSTSPDGSLSLSRTATMQSRSDTPHWDPYRGQWVGGKYGYGPTPAADRYPYYGDPYGSPSYPYYGGYVSSSVYAAGLRTGLYNVP
jgi:hypothetical protein